MNLTSLLFEACGGFEPQRAPVRTLVLSILADRIIHILYLCILLISEQCLIHLLTMPDTDNLDI